MISLGEFVNFINSITDLCIEMHYYKLSDLKTSSLDFMKIILQQ